MLRKYRITAGTFRQADDTLLGAGAAIELDDDVAQRFANQIERVKDEPAPGSLIAKPTRRADRSGE